MFEFLMNPVAQDPAYHALADQRVVLGIPNFWNVVSNLAFLAAGWAGLAETARHRAEPLRVAWFTFFAGIATVGYWIHTEQLGAMIAAYALAKVVEHYDAAIYGAGQLLSGHTLKHLAAAAGVTALLAGLRRRRRTGQAVTQIPE
jgi:hypothetical protein